MATTRQTDLDQAQLAEDFHRLAAEWGEATMFMSSLTAMIRHPAYQQIIGMGLPVLPLILRELQERPSHWFWALHEISGEDPARGEAEFERALEAWLDWGRAKGYI